MTASSPSDLEVIERAMVEWHEYQNSPEFDVTSFLNNLCVSIERQLNIFLNSNHDPFDERHPSKIDPTSEYGRILRSLGTQPGFLETIACYMESNNPGNPKGAAALRFFCGVYLGISIPYTAAEDDSTSKTLYDIAMSTVEPVNYYATMLLGIIMASEESIYANRANNENLIPIVLRRMHVLSEQIPSATPQTSEGARNIISSFHLEPPLNLFVKIRMCIWYLLPLAEYVDLMPLMSEQNITGLIYKFISKEFYQLDICLTFDALRLLSSLLCHRFVHLSFVEDGGLEKVLDVPYPSVAATAVSIVLYFTAYFEDAMERVCLLPSDTITKIIKYALWLIECSHPSARCYSIYFLHIAFQYGNCFRILKNCNALTYLYNSMTVLPLRLTEEINTAKDTTSWHIVRAALNAIKRYCEISLFHWMDSIDHSLSSLLDQAPKMVSKLGHRPITYTSEQFFRVLVHLVNRVRPNMTWKSAIQLADMGAILLLYRIIASNYYSSGNWPWRNEVARLSVEILNLMAILYPLADQIASSEIPQFQTDNDLFSDDNHGGGHHHHHHGDHGHHGGRNGGDLPFSLIETLVNDLVRNNENMPDVDFVISNNAAPRQDNSTANNTNNRPNITANNNANGGPLNHSRNLYLLSDPEDENSQDGPRPPRHTRPPFLSEMNSNENSNSSSMVNNNPSPSLHSSSSTTQVNQNNNTNSEKVNCLLLLMSFSCDQEIFDSSVVKAVLTLLNTLVYKPIDENENIEHPVLANTVTTSQELNYPKKMLSLQGSSMLKELEGGLAKNNSPSRMRQGSPTLLSRKRRFEDQTGPATTSNDSNLLDNPVNRTVGNMITETSMPSPYARQKQTHLLYRQSKLWHIIRKQHGIMTLIFHINTKSPIKDADSIRTLACRALVGLARYEEARSILAKLPLFSKSIIAQLMKEPILLDRLAQHSEFCRYSNNLIRLVVGQIPSDLTDPTGSISDISIEKVRKAAIVASTKINWDPDELLEIIYRHLEAKGLHETADHLLREANLRLPQPITTNHMAPFPLYDVEMMTPPKADHGTSGNVMNKSSLSGSSALALTANGQGKKDDLNSSFITPSSIRYNKPIMNSQSGTPRSSQITPRATHLNNQASHPHIPGIPSTIPSQSLLPSTSNHLVPTSTGSKYSEDILSNIVSSYLRQQHSLCPHPMSTCPKFSLYTPHRCPNPGLPIPENNVIRHWQRQQLGGASKMRLSYKQERKFLHSRFYPDIIVRDSDDDILNCCFSVADDGLFVGTQSGSIGWVDLESESVPHELVGLRSKSIRHMEQSKDGSRLLVVSEWGEPCICVVKLAPKNHVGMPSFVGATADARSQWDATFDPNDQIPNHDFSHAEFSNTGNQTRLIATEGFTARIYDLNTNQQLSRLHSVDKQSGYKVNKACFSYDDNLVLNDGVVWDVRLCNASRPIHKLDKFQDLVSGRFHPNQLEIVIGSAIWDMRMWRLVKTVSAMDRQTVKFSPNNDVIYSGLFHQDEIYLEYEDNKNPMKSMFRTLDAADYSLIATIDVKHQIEHMTLDPSGHFVALVEYVGLHENNKTQCRIYTVGRKKTGRGSGDNEDEDEVNMSGEDESDNTSSDSSSDDDDEDSFAEGEDDDSNGSHVFWTDLDSYGDTEEDAADDDASAASVEIDNGPDDSDDTYDDPDQENNDEIVLEANTNSAGRRRRGRRGDDQDSNGSWVTTNSNSSSSSEN